MLPPNWGGSDPMMLPKRCGYSALRDTLMRRPYDILWCSCGNGALTVLPGDTDTKTSCCEASVYHRMLCRPAWLQGIFLPVACHQHCLVASCSVALRTSSWRDACGSWELRPTLWSLTQG